MFFAVTLKTFDMLNCVEQLRAFEPIIDRVKHFKQP